MGRTERSKCAGAHESTRVANEFQNAVLPRQSQSRFTKPVHRRRDHRSWLQRSFTEANEANEENDSQLLVRRSPAAAWRRRKHWLRLLAQQSSRTGKSPDRLRRSKNEAQNVKSEDATPFFHSTPFRFDPFLLP